jgi:hypothetical protein
MYSPMFPAIVMSDFEIRYVFTGSRAYRSYASTIAYRSYQKNMRRRNTNMISLVSLTFSRATALGYRQIIRGPCP